MTFAIVIVALSYIVALALIIALYAKLSIARADAIALEAENEALREQLRGPKLCPHDGKPCDGNPKSQFCGCYKSSGGAS